jgi:hypothetical protein
MDIATHFRSPRALLERAGKHIEDANRAVETFFSPPPAEQFIEHDESGRMEIHKVRLIEDIPDQITATVKDATSNLRDALDHAVYGASVALVGGNPDDTGFPFAGTEAELSRALATRLKGVPQALRPYLESWKTFHGEGGNSLLCGLNRLRNPSTHRILVPVGSAMTAQKFHARRVMVKGGGQLGYSNWNPETKEIEYMRIGRESTFDYELTVRFGVVFGEILGLSGKPVIPTLRNIADEVENVIDGIQAETTKLLGPSDGAGSASDPTA